MKTNINKNVIVVVVVLCLIFLFSYGDLWRLLVVPILAVPLFAWYVVMTNVRNEDYPKWLKRIFGLKYVGKILEFLIVTLAALIVLAMIIFFELPNNL